MGEQYREKQEPAAGEQEAQQLKDRMSFMQRVKRCCGCKVNSQVEDQTLETKILENAIIKLGSLLALGFGEAGSEIIGQNMDDENANVNAMIPGSKVEAVYGFC